MSTPTPLNPKSSEEALFQAAGPLDKPARKLFLDWACAREPELRQRLEDRLFEDDVSTVIRPQHLPEEDLFQAAILLPAAARASFLAVACNAHASLRQRLEALLAAHVQPETLLEPQANRRDGLHEFPSSAQGVAELGPQDQETSRRTIKLDLPDAADEAVGQTLGRYKLLEKVGEGGCGAVYVAEQTEPVRRRVALKVIKLGMDTKAVVARFEAERQALAMMDHPNIARVFDAGTTETGRPYFIMELVRGIRITDYCDQNNLSTRERLDLFIKVCQAIQHAHQKGIIHRDIKPSNILVTLHDGVPVPKVIDFGIAKATEGRLTDATVYTQLHQFIGTPAYMSPEQAEMSGLDIDTRSDIYSLGVLLYELLAGSTPFDAKELMASGIDAMRKTIREKEPVRPSTRLATLKGEELTTTAKRRSSEAPKLIHLLKGDLDWIVMKCLEKDRTRRYETANGLAADLKRHLNNEPVVARPPSPGYRLQKAWRRNKWIFNAGAAVTLALALGLLVSTWQAIRARRARGEAVANEKRALQAQSDTERQRQLAEAARDEAEAQAYASDINLAQHAVANANLGQALYLLGRQRPKDGRPDRRGWEWRYLWQQCQSDSLAPPLQVSNRFWSLTISHDGKWLAAPAIGPSGGVSIIDISDTHRLRLVEKLATGEGGCDAAFSPRQALLAFSTFAFTPEKHDKHTLHLWDANSRRMVREAPLSGQLSRLVFSQDGEKLLTFTFSYPEAEADVALWRIPSLERMAVEPRILAAVKGIESRTYPIFTITPDFALAAVVTGTGVSGGRAILLQVIDWVTGETRWSSKVNGVADLGFSPNGKLLFLAEGLGVFKVRILDSLSGGEIGPGLSDHRDWVSGLAFWPDGKTVATSSADRTIRLYDIADPARPQAIGAPLKGHGSEVKGLALLPDQRTLVSVGKDGTFLTWDTQNAKTDRTHLSLHLSSDFSWNFAPDSKSIITIETSGQVTEWSGFDFETRDMLVNVGRCDLGLCALSRDCRLLARGSTNGVVEVWDLGRRARVKEFTADPGNVAALEFRGANKTLITFGEGTDLTKEWDLATLKELGSWQDFEGPSQFSGDERWYCTAGCRAGIFLIRDLTTGAQILHTNVEFNVGDPTSLAISTDTKLLAVSGWAGVVQLFEREPFRPIDTLRGFLREAVFSVCFSPDGKRLATTSSGREAIKLWDVNRRQELLRLDPGDQGGFRGACFSPDGNILGAALWLGDEPDTLHLWRAPAWADIAAAEAKEKAENRRP